MRCLALTLSLLPLPALAQEYVPLGIGFVQAAEQYSGAVIGTDAAQVFQQATEACTGAGAMVQDCQVMAWCQPMGWAIDVFLMHTEGPHWHEFHCGLPDQETALAVAAQLCNGGVRTYLLDCALVQMWDAEGNLVLGERADPAPDPAKN